MNGLGYSNNTDSHTQCITYCGFAVCVRAFQFQNCSEVILKCDVILTTSRDNYGLGLRIRLRIRLRIGQRSMFRMDRLRCKITSFSASSQTYRCERVWVCVGAPPEIKQPLSRDHCLYLHNFQNNYKQHIEHNHQLIQGVTLEFNITGSIFIIIFHIFLYIVQLCFVDTLQTKHID